MTIPALRSCLYEGKVMHRRFAPAHRFSYRLFWMLIDLDELKTLDRTLPLFAVNRAAPVAFHERDHGPRDGSPLRAWIDEQLAAAGLNLGGGPVRILCLPRILGYTFNPLSVWFCHDRAGRLGAVLYEVSNTFGERHSYLFPVRNGNGEAVAPHGCDKAFYVSPFTDMATRYAFRLVPPADAMSLHIRQSGGVDDVLVATMAGRRIALTGRSLAGALVRHPLVTLKVMAAILWQAGRLWRKGARPRVRPVPPERTVTFVPDELPPLDAAA
ncbi:MAG: DUF1365 domain-containing protein [Alphaproteobacteria bacterium]|jgi:DUF1365 family protein